MAISPDGGVRHRAEINVTPMIDVLPVLIIIFMVITPLTPRGLETLLPESPTSQTPVPPRSDIVITVRSDRIVLLNQEAVDLPELGR